MDNFFPLLYIRFNSNKRCYLNRYWYNHQRRTKRILLISPWSRCRKSGRNPRSRISSHDFSKCPKTCANLIYTLIYFRMATTRCISNPTDCVLLTIYWVDIQMDQGSISWVPPQIVCHQLCFRWTTRLSMHNLRI